MFSRRDLSAGATFPGVDEQGGDTWDKTLLLKHKQQSLSLSWRKKFEEIETVL